MRPPSSPARPFSSLAHARLWCRAAAAAQGFSSLLCRGDGVPSGPPTSEFLASAAFQIPEGEPSFHTIRFLPSPTYFFPLARALRICFPSRCNRPMVEWFGIFHLYEVTRVSFFWII
jgi:hypothetical protein